MYEIAFFLFMKKILFTVLVILLISCDEVKSDRIASIDVIDKNPHLTLAQVSAYLKKAEEEVREISNDSVRYVHQLRIANRYWNFQDYNNYKKIVLEIKRSSEKTGDGYFFGKANLYLYDLYRGNSEGLRYLNAAITEFISMENSLELVQALRYKANYLHDNGNYVESEKYAYYALKNIGESKMNSERAAITNLLGLINNEIGEYDRALSYFDETINIYRQGFKGDNFLPILLPEITDFNRALVYTKMQRFHEAEKILLSLKVNELIKKQNVKFYLKVLDLYYFVKFKCSKIPSLDLYSSLILENRKNGFKDQEIEALLHYALIMQDLGRREECIEKLLAASVIAKKNRFLVLSTVVNKELVIFDPKKENVGNYIDSMEELNLLSMRVRDKYFRIDYDLAKRTIERDYFQSQNRSLKILGYLSIILILSLAFYNQILKRKKIESENRELILNQKVYSNLLMNRAENDKILVEERNRIARDLHDGVMNNLATIRLRLNSNEGGLEERKELITDLQSVELEIRSVAHELSKFDTFEKDSFVDSVEKLIKTVGYCNSGQIKFDYDTSIVWESWTLNQRVDIYRILQEALGNVFKHSEPDFVSINISSSQDEVFITVKNRGKFKKNRQSGLGLKNIEDRLKTYKGRMNVYMNSKEFVLEIKIVKI